MQADTPSEATSRDRKGAALRERMSMTGTYRIFLSNSPGGTLFQYIKSETQAMKPSKRNNKGETKLNHISS